MSRLNLGFTVHSLQLEQTTCEVTEIMMDFEICNLLCDFIFSGDCVFLYCQLVLYFYLSIEACQHGFALFMHARSSFRQGEFKNHYGFLLPHFEIGFMVAFLLQCHLLTVLVALFLIIILLYGNNITILLISTTCVNCPYAHKGF